MTPLEGAATNCGDAANLSGPCLGANPLSLAGGSPDTSAVLAVEGIIRLVF